MNLQEAVEAIPGRVTESIKSLFASGDERVATATKASTDANAARASAEKERDDFKARAAQAEADLATARQSIATQGAELKAAQEKLTKLEASQKTVEQLAAEKSQQQCAAQGVPPGTLEKAKSGADAGSSKGQQITRAQFEALSHKDKAAFCKGGGEIKD